MKSSSRRTGLAFLAALTAAALTAAPVTADTPLSESGTTGFHNLRDSQSEPGVQCRYSRVTPSPFVDYEGKLTTLVVRPPRMKASVGSGTQKVGWLFIVQRSRSGGPWSTKYTSPIQTRMTNASTNAAFAEMSVGITVPNDAYEGEIRPIYQYRVRVFMFWYTTAGNHIVGQSIHQVGYYRRVLRPLEFAEHSYTATQPCVHSEEFGAH